MDYGANNGTEWIILTNGLIWKVYKVRFEKPIRTDLVCEFNLLELKLKNQSDMDKLFILCKEGLKKNAIDDFSQHRMIVNKYYITTVLRSEAVIESLKKELKKVDAQIKFDDDEILGILNNEVLKRELVDSQDTADANDKYNKIVKKLEKKKNKDVSAKAVTDKPNITENNEVAIQEEETVVEEVSL